MTAMVISLQQESQNRIASDRQLRISVHIQADVLDAEIARRKANVWLLENAGNLLGATTPELVLGERLRWRYDIVLSEPDLTSPGQGKSLRVGQIVLDAVTGEVLEADRLIEELRTYAAARAG